MADRYTIDTTRFIPPNLRGIASTLGLDDASNMNAVVSMFMRPRDAAARYSEPEKYSPTGKRETSDLIEAGMGPAEALLGVGVGRFLSEPIRRTLMSMLGIDSGDVSKFSTTDRSVPKTDFEAMYGGDRGSLDAASMTDSELLDMFNREYPDAEDAALQSAMFDDEEMGLPVPDYYDPEYVPDMDDIQEMMEDGATAAEVRQLMDQQSRLNVDPVDELNAQIASEFRLLGRPPDDDPETLARYGYTMGDDGVAVPIATAPDGTPVITANNGFTVHTAADYDPNLDQNTTPYTAEYLAAEAAAQARDDAGIVDDFDPSIAFPDGNARNEAGVVIDDGMGELGYDEAALAEAAGDATDFTQVPFSPQVGYELKERGNTGLQAALQTVSRKSGLKFPDGEAAFKALKSQGVTDAELEARGLMSLKDLTDYVDIIDRSRMFSGSPDDIDLSAPIRITELRDAGTDYEQYFTKGGTDYLETVFTLRDSNLGPNVSRQLKNKTMGHHPDIQQGAEGPTLFHTRSAVYEVAGGGSTFHLGEIQSDVNNNSRAILKNRKILEDLGSDRSDMLSSMYYTGGLGPNASASYASRAASSKDQEILDLLEGTIFKKNIVEANDSSASVQAGFGPRFDQIPVTEQVDKLMAELTDLRNTRGNKTASELGVGKLYDTATITRMAIRRSLEQATDSGADFFTLGTGQMAKDMTYGELGGQQEYYDKIVPGALKKVLNKLGADSKLEMPKIEEIPMYGADQDGAETMFMVPGFRMTDNFRKAVAEFGMPVFRDGGRVDVSRFTGLGSMGYML